MRVSILGRGSHGLSLAGVVTTGLLLAVAPQIAGQDARYLRGDANGDGVVDVSDPLATLIGLFWNGGAPACEDAVDANDDGSVDVSDAVFSLGFLFSTDNPIPPPGPLACGTDPTEDDLTCLVYDAPNCKQNPPDTSVAKTGHLLNRIAYGPTQAAVDRVNTLGIEGYIDEQLNPERIDESGNTALNQRVESLFSDFQPTQDTVLLRVGSFWRYWKGTAAPPSAWRQTDFDDSGWSMGPTSIGYGDGDDATILADMRDNYVSVFLRTEFVANPAAIDKLILRVDYDDGFVAYLNGRPVASSNLSPGAPYTRVASPKHEAGEVQDFDITARKSSLVDGVNVLAIQVHNGSLDSSDLTIQPELVSRSPLPVEPVRLINGVEGLQRLVHVRGIYSEKQLQAVLAEFWENHFTTDYDKVAEYFDGLQNSDATDAMSEAQARREAAQLEYLEYQFFYDNALGNVGDLLLYSAASPTMLIYLDNVSNFKAEPNENYSREILELFAFGVDNDYNQTDIEALAKAFTGWFVCKVAPDDVQSFPESALTPPVDCGVKFNDTEIVGLGSGWKYFKGTEEPTPDQGGEPTTAWAMPDFDDSAWTNGSTGIGYGDGDDRTVLRDMRRNYFSVYLRRTITIADPLAFKNLLLEVAYDDGFVAYLNGFEVARSDSMDDQGTPPAFDQDADDGHEVDEGVEYFNLNTFLSILTPGENVLAIQVHNVNLDSSDLSMLPRLLDREILPGSIENGDPNGAWSFRFDPEEHHLGRKTLFRGTPYQVDIPSGRRGPAGLQDALDVVQSMVDHPAMAEFICIKLIQKFVCDDITLARFEAGDVSPELVELLADAIAAWNSTTPRGNIKTVMTAILDPTEQTGHFWSPEVFRAKVKTPIEYVNSTLRALDSAATGDELPELSEEMGMHLFTRDDPDGWSELGFDWVATNTMLARIEFSRELADDGDSDYTWDATEFLTARELITAQEIVDYFDDLLFQGSLPETNRQQLVEFVSTDSRYNALPLNPARSSYERRVRELVGLMLSLPHWHFQ